MTGKDKPYSLGKSKKSFFHFYFLFKKKKSSLSQPEQTSLTDVFSNLQNALLNKDKTTASEHAKRLEELGGRLLKKSTFRKTFDFIFALAFAIFVAFIVRQTWFELYEIPTGSMRPTLMEKDRLIVSKTNFAINIPMTLSHILLEPELIDRNRVIVFTGEGMDIPDVDTVYFYLFPGKKQFVKRLMGKPGDTLYFYGGKMYGIDSQGKDISSDLQLPSLSKIEHIPFIHFEGKVTTSQSLDGGVCSTAIIHQMNEPIAKLYCTPYRQIDGEMLVQKDIAHFSDLWGFKNYGMTRLLTKNELDSLSYPDTGGLEEGMLYLEIRHHPSLKHLQIISDAYGRIRPTLHISTSILPLKEENLKKMFESLYTARFIVKNGYAYRYGSHPDSRYQIKLTGIPDGMYEFYYGKAYEVLWQGITKQLPPSHPLSQFDLERFYTLYNFGMELDKRAMYPARYAYFYEKNLYLMGAPIIKEHDPILSSFLDREYTKQSMSKPNSPYFAFEDAGPPVLENGKLNIEFIQKYGLKIPAKGYLALGDNHAMSGDSRSFGFVPESNLRGEPEYIFWPPGSRFGMVNQPSEPLFNLPRVIVWIFFGILIAFWYYVHKKRHQLPKTF